MTSPVLLPDSLGFASLSESDYGNLLARWITRDFADLANIRRVSSDAGRSLVGRERGDMAGLVIPNYWPGEDHPREYRLRRDQPELKWSEERKAYKEVKKYLSPPGGRNMLYIPVGVTQDLLDSDVPVVLTEGEFKAIALWRLATADSDVPRFVPLAVSGVWNWRGTIGKPAPRMDRVAMSKERSPISTECDGAGEKYL